MKTKQSTVAQERFNQFCKERHAEDKGRNYNTLQEIYANTELFDMSLLDIDLDNFNYNFSHSITEGECRTTVEWLKDYTLPFANIFLSLGGADSPSKTCIFIREYSFTIITGTYNFLSKKGVVNMPFTIHTDTGEVIFNGIGFAMLESGYTNINSLKLFIMTHENVAQAFKEGIEKFFKMALANLKALTQLPKHSVVADVTEKVQYYPRKKATTLKVTRPIYYVLSGDEKEVTNRVKTINACGTLHFDHSFKVRGHWRRLHNPTTLGKDRNGEFKIKGFTYVKSYTKGEGELIKRIRIVK